MIRWAKWKKCKIDNSRLKQEIKRYPEANATTNPCPANTQPSHDEIPFSQMSKEHFGIETPKIFMSIFGFAKSLVCTIDGGRDAKELENYIVRESACELEYLLNILLTVC